MKPDKLLHVFHPVQRKAKALEDTGHHLASDDIVAVEGPSYGRIIALCGGLADVVHQSSPAKGQAVRGGGHIVQYRKRMGEIVFVSPAVHGLHSLQGGNLRKDVRQQPGPVHKAEGQRGAGRSHHLVELFSNTLHREDGEAVGHTAHRFHRLGHDFELQVWGAELGSETHGAKHTQRVVGIGGIGVKRSADDAGGKVAYASERINESPEIVFLQAQGQGVDGEIPPFLVVFQSAVLDDRLAGLAPV